MSLLSVFLGREICSAPDWPGCDEFGQYDAVMNSDDIEAFIDKNAEEFLKEELALMPAGFRAISVPGDGNCLAHAVSKSQIGIELLYHALRQELQQELRDHKDWYWKKCIPFFDEESATEFIENAAREAIPGADRDQEFAADECVGMAEFLGPIHIHAMANVLRRPIVLIAARALWEQSLSGLYLPERREPAHWTTATHAQVLEAVSAVLKEPSFETSQIRDSFRSWASKLEFCQILEPWASASVEDRKRDSQTIGELCDELAAVLHGWLPAAGAVAEGGELASRARRVYKAISSLRLRTPIYIAWASPALAHFVCLLPSAAGGVLPRGLLPISRKAMPQRDGKLVVLGEAEPGLSREASAELYLEGGCCCVRGATWPHREQFLEKVEEFWKKEHPSANFQDTVLEKGWNILLPNLLNNILDIAQLFKSLNVEDDDDPVWLKVGSTRLLVPRRVERLTWRLPYLTNLLSQASDRMRPIWITTPDQSSVVAQGEDCKIEWGTISRIASMVEKKTGLKLEEQMVEIGWMLAGTGNFSANIAKSVAFHARSHTWRVSDNMRPGKYWIAVRLLPFADTQMEGAGPPAGSFRVIPRADAGAPAAAVSNSNEDRNMAREWEYSPQRDGRWYLMAHDICDTLNRAYGRDDCNQVIVKINTDFAEIDFEQMKLTLGFNTLPIRIKGDFKVSVSGLAALKDMGFREEDCKHALETYNNDVEMASLWLMDGQDSISRDNSGSLPGPVDEEIKVDSPDSPYDRGSSGATEELETDFENLPSPFGPLLCRQASLDIRADGAAGTAGAVCVREIDGSAIPELDLHRGADSSAEPHLFNAVYMQKLEQEARSWELKGESLWQKVEEELDREASLQAVPLQPRLHRLKTDAGPAQTLSLPPQSNLSRTSSAPAVMSGLSRHQWASMFRQARNLYRGT